MTSGDLWHRSVGCGGSSQWKWRRFGELLRKFWSAPQNTSRASSVQLSEKGDRFCCPITPRQSSVCGKTIRMCTVQEFDPCEQACFVTGGFAIKELRSGGDYYSCCYRRDSHNGIACSILHKCKRNCEYQGHRESEGSEHTSRFNELLRSSICPNVHAL